jgi:Cleft lip and palate transmembrane protein 1 (CLPTM1)
MIKSAIQGLVMFFGIQFVMGKFMNSGKATTTTTTDASGTVVKVPANTAEIPPYYARPDHLDEGALYNPLAQRIAPMWPLDSPMDITIVVSPTFVSEPLAKTPKERIVVEEVAFKFGDYQENRVIDTTFPVPKEVQNNGTLWAHFYIGLTGSGLDPSTSGYNPERAFHFIHPLTQYIAQKKIKKTKNLLAAVNETEEVCSVQRGCREMLTVQRSKRKYRLGQSSPLTIIQTSQCLSSRTAESCIIPLFILLLDNIFIWSPAVQEMAVDRMDGIIPFCSSILSGN